MSYITKELAIQLFEKNQTPSHVIRHCMAVSRVSVILATELNKCGYTLSIEVIEGAAMLHDIARVKEDHGAVGAEIAEEQGFSKEAFIIKEHMHYNITSDINQLKEIDLVCLGDRMVKEDEYVGVKERMNYILEKWKGNAKAEESLKNRIKEYGILLKEIEDLLGKKIDELMDEKGNKE